jgi:aerobic carbon-monoxide dehydrogenase medium subunit
LKPPRFTYLAPDSPEAAVRYLAQYKGEARCLSGGQSLIPLMNYRLIQPAALIDLNRCTGLDYVQREHGKLVIGPMTRQSTVEYSELVRECCPLISKTMVYLGSPTIRNRGTIGGTIAHADRTAELPAVMVVLEAELVALGPGGLRTIPVEEFFIGDLTTALNTDEMLREIRVPLSPDSSLCAFVETGNRHHDLALAGVAVHMERAADGVIGKARVACIGIGLRPVRLEAAEQALRGARLDEEAIRRASESSLGGIDFDSDIHATGKYRRAVLPGLVARALQQAAADGAKRR